MSPEWGSIQHQYEPCVLLNTQSPNFALSYYRRIGIVPWKKIHHPILVQTLLNCTVFVFAIPALSHGTWLPATTTACHTIDVVWWQPTALGLGIMLWKAQYGWRVGIINEFLIINYNSSVETCPQIHYKIHKWTVFWNNWILQQAVRDLCLCCLYHVFKQCFLLTTCGNKCSYEKVVDGLWNASSSYSVFKHGFFHYLLASIEV